MNVSRDDAKLIVECLLMTTIDCCGNWDEREDEKILDLAKSFINIHDFKESDLKSIEIDDSPYLEREAATNEIKELLKQ